MRIFATGVTGFLGRAFCRAAHARGHEVLGLCRDRDLPSADGFVPVSGSLSKIPWSSIEAFGPDAVLHMAWTATPGVYLTAPENETLVEQSQALFTGLMDRGVNQLAGVGTCIEYAASSEILDERLSPIAPVFPYSRAKRRLGDWLQSESGKRGTTWSWFRVFYPYGLGEHEGRFPTYVLRQLQRREPVLLKTPHSVKDYVHVTDVANAFLSGLEANLSGPVNVGSGQGVSIIALAQRIAVQAGADPSLIRPSEVLGVDPAPHVVASVARLRTTGWSPQITLDRGLAEMVSFMFPDASAKAVR